MPWILPPNITIILIMEDGDLSMDQQLLLNVIFIIKCIWQKCSWSYTGAELELVNRRYNLLLENSFI